MALVVPACSSLTQALNRRADARFSARVYMFLLLLLMMLLLFSFDPHWPPPSLSLFRLLHVVVFLPVSRYGLEVKEDAVVLTLAPVHTHVADIQQLGNVHTGGHTA